MRNRLRPSMAWLHTWAGLLAGGVAYFIFVTGTVGYFFVEIDRWMRPELPLPVHGIPVARMLTLADRVLRTEGKDADEWRVELPVGRSSELAISWSIAAGASADAGAGGGDDDDQHRPPAHRLVFDPRVAAFRDAHVRETGGGFELYGMHWRLRYVPQEFGVMLVGAIGITILVALITGIVAHKKIFAEYFTFRPGRGQRSWLDAHNVTSVLALPFLVMIIFTGLVFAMDFYVPGATMALYGSGGARPAAFDAERYELAEQPPRTRRDAPVLALDQLVSSIPATLDLDWDRDAIDRLTVVSPGDPKATVHVYHNGHGRLQWANSESVVLSAVDGRVIRHVSTRESLGRRTQSVLFSLHEGTFSGVALRWLYFMSGLAGCVMIATGLVLWIVKRKEKAKYATKSGWGAAHTVVERLNVGTIAGLPIGVAAYFWANRLLPVDLPRRADWEMHTLFIIWGVMLVYPAIRSVRRAWIEELSIAAGLFALLPLLNALTTNRHLGVSIPAGDWAIAGFDLTAFAMGTALALTAALVHTKMKR